METSTTISATNDRRDAFLHPPVDRIWVCSIVVHAIAMVSFLCIVMGFVASRAMGDTVLSAGVAIGIFLTGALAFPSGVLLALRRDALTTLAMVMTSSAAWTAWSIAENTVG